MESAHEISQKELREYYEKMMGDLDVNQKQNADKIMKDEESKIALRTNVLHAAGEMESIKVYHPYEYCLAAMETYIVYFTPEFLL